MCCKANLSPAEMNKAISGPQQKIISYALYTAADTITAVLNRIRLLGEIAICFLMLVPPSTKINSNNRGSSFVAEKCTGSRGDLGIKMSLGGLPKHRGSQNLNSFPIDEISKERERHSFSISCKSPLRKYEHLYLVLRSSCSCCFF